MQLSTRDETASTPRNRTPTWIAIGLLAGVVVGIVFGEYCRYLRVVGQAYVGLLQMTVLPYLTVSLTGKLGRLDLHQARKLAIVALLLALGVLGLAVALGLDVRAAGELAIRAAHVLAAMVWAGFIVFVNLVQHPAILAAKAEERPVLIRMIAAPAARVFTAVADANVSIDMIVQNVSVDGATDISFTMPSGEVAYPIRVTPSWNQPVYHTWKSSPS